MLQFAVILENHVPRSLSHPYRHLSPSALDPVERPQHLVILNKRLSKSFVRCLWLLPFWDLTKPYRSILMAIVDFSAEEQRKPDIELLSLLLQESAKRHSHLCPRQVLGVRLGLCALRTLELIGYDYQPRFLNLDKRLLTIVETDGCGADGISIATTCSVGRRTLRVLDFGKLAATLVDTHNNRAVRVVPSSLAREKAVSSTPDSGSRWHAYLRSYQVLPDKELIVQEEVQLTRTISEILSKPSKRVLCDICREEIMNEREVYTESQILCKGCAGESYYVPKR